MESGVSLTLLLALEMTFFLLGCFVKLLCKAFCFVVLYLLLSCLVVVSWRPVVFLK